MRRPRTSSARSHLVRAAGVALVVLGLLAGPAGVASADTAPAPPPGFSAQKWAGAYIERLFAFPTTQTYTCKTGQSYKLYFVVLNSAQDNCALPAGTPLLVAGAWVECSTLEAFPFFGGTDTELAGCVDRYWRRWFRSTSVFVDGRQLTGVGRHIVQSPAFDFTLPARDNILGTTETHGRSVVRGMFMYLPPFPPGAHTVTTAQAYNDGSTLAFTFHFTAG